MDEMEQTTETKRARVMRAVDVIPPFGERGTRPDDGKVQAKPSGRTGSKRGGDGDEPTVSAVQKVNSSGDRPQRAVEPPVAFVEIPTFNLAENILAEQRRTASRRRRRAPRQGDEEPLVSAEPVRSCLSDPEPSTHDFLELQQIVAQIVARDIERLCKRSGTQLPA